MKNIFFKKIKTTKREAGAMMILLLVFFVIFILAFGSAYLVFLNTSRSVDMSHGIKARQAAAAGKERALYEAIKNNYDFAGACIAFSSTEIFSQELSDGSSYSINCVDDGVNKSFFAIGKYKRVEASLEIDCINIEKECSESCPRGSICGGGKLFKNEKINYFVVSPSACNSGGTACDNEFLINDSLALLWDNATSSYMGADNLDDGKINITILNPQVNTQLEAAKYCDDLEVNGFSDWYLPAVYELEVLRDDSALPYFNLIVNHYKCYLSSSEQSSAYPDDVRCVEALYQGNIFQHPKNLEANIRCIRR